MRVPSLLGPASYRGRPAVLVGLAAVALGVFALLAGPFSSALDSQNAIERAQEILARTRLAAAQRILPAPLWGDSQAALATTFRARLDALASGRAVVIDEARADADPGRPNAPRLQAVARGTSDGLHGLLLALETQPPFVVIEKADLTVASRADSTNDRPTVMRVVFTARGFVVPPKAPGRLPAATGVAR